MKKQIGNSALVCCAAVALFIASVPARADYEGYTEAPLSSFDLTKNPGCGVKGLTVAEKIKRNVNVAEFYHQSYAAMENDTINRHDWSEYDCMADGATFVVGVYMPPPAKPISFPKSSSAEEARRLVHEGNAGSQKEVRMWKKVYPNLRAVPGTFRVITAWEGGVNWAMAFDATAKDGEHIFYWEINTILINNEGKITHMDCWDDGYGVANAWKKVTGKSFDEIKQNPSVYFKSLDELGDKGAK